MNWDDAAESMLGFNLTSFGSIYPYTHSASSITEDILGIFDTKYTGIDPISGMVVQSNEPNLGIRLSDLSSPPAKGDTVVIKTVNYRVLRAEKDGTGATLFLQKV